MKNRSHSIPALDGLRAAAALVVLGTHAGYTPWFFPAMEYGNVGIKLFFTLSGFLITYYYFTRTFSPRYWAAFLLRRTFRIYPAMAIASVLYFLCESHGIPFDDSYDYAHTVATWKLDNGTGIFWTIPKEMDFYFQFPLLALLFTVLPFPPKATLLLLAGIWSELALFLDKPFTAYFMAGTVAGYILRHPEFWAWIPQRCWNICAACCVVAQTYTSPPVFAAMGIEIPYPYIYHVWIFSLLAGLTVTSVALCNGAVRWLFSNKVMLFIGSISYSLYLTHEIVFALMRMVPRNVPSVAVFAAVFTAAWLFYQCVESPFNKLGHTLSTRMGLKKTAAAPHVSDVAPEAASTTETGASA